MSSDNMVRVHREFPTVEEDAELCWLERRWFAAHKCSEAMRAHCEELRRELELAHANWRCAHSELAEVETLRDILAREYERSISSEDSAPRIRQPVAPAA